MKTLAVNPAVNCQQRARRSISLTVWALVCAMGLGLFGCALHKPPTHPAIVAQALPDATPLPLTWSSTPSILHVDDGWLASFHDDGLEIVVNEAISNNLDLRQAAAKVQEARQNVVVVGSQLKPQFNAPLSGATTYSSDANGTQQNESSTVLVEVSWEIDVWGRIRSQRAASQENYEAVALDYAFARQSLAATTAKSWYLAIETRQLLGLTVQSVEVYQRLLALVKIRRAAGKVSNLDVAEASYQLAEAQGQLTVAQGLYSEARRTLEVLIGHFPTAEFQVADEFAALPIPVAPGLPSSLLERRPDLLASEHQVLAAFRTQQAAKLALLPSFSLNIEGGRLSDPLLSVLGLNPWLVHSALGMMLPIYQGGALRAQVKIATAEQQQSVAKFGAVSLRAFAEVEDALTNERQLGKHLPFSEGAVHDHTEAVRIANLRYKSGSMDLLSVLQLQEGQIESQAQLIELRNAQLANNIDLHLAVGGSFDSSPANFSGVQNQQP
jgi:outer membrane protein, multidrug efflux system